MELIAYQLARRWPSPVEDLTKIFRESNDLSDAHIVYARRQFERKIKEGFSWQFRGLSVLDIGCGCGGGTVFFALNGAKRSVGLDVNSDSLKAGAAFKAEIEAQLGLREGLPVEFISMDASAMSFESATFDLVVADNLVEHIMNPFEVLREIFRVLKPGGILAIPVFSSIYSKYGLHLKHGLKFPWANLFFSEKTIVGAMKRLANDDPLLLKIYPGLNRESIESVRDLRKHRDLNGITFGEFWNIAKHAGFEIKEFKILRTPFGRIFRMIPGFDRTRLAEILSFGASATLVKVRET